MEYGKQVPTSSYTFWSNPFNAHDPDLLSVPSWNCSEYRIRVSKLQKILSIASQVFPKVCVGRAKQTKKFLSQATLGNTMW